MILLAGAATFGGVVVTLIDAAIAGTAVSVTGIVMECDNIA